MNMITTQSPPGTDPVGIAVNDADGNIVFDDLIFSNPGVYNYIMKEISASGGGWTVDPTEYPVQVVVSAGADGKLNAQVNYPNGAPVFQNTYVAEPSEPGDVLVTAQKNLEGAQLEYHQFAFSIYDCSGNHIVTAQNDENGHVEFQLPTPAAPGVYYYTVHESSPPADGIVADDTVYQVKLTVAEDGGVTVEYPDGEPVFNNKAQVPALPDPPGTIVTAQKNLEGAQLEYHQFAFSIYDCCGNHVATAQNDENGHVEFQLPTPAVPGVYYYTVHESSPPADGIAADDKVFTVKLTVAEDGGVAVEYPDGEPVFNNKAQVPTLPDPPSVLVTAQKNLEGAQLEFNQFGFSIYDCCGNHIVTAQNDENGHVEFQLPTPAVPGVYYYTMHESSPPADGIAADDTVYQVKLTVAQDGSVAVEYLQNGQIINGPPVFTNRAQEAAAPVTALVQATKTLDGAQLEDNQFEFSVFDVMGKTLSVGRNKADGTVDFPGILLSRPGDYHYFVREITPSSPGWITDNRVYPVHITVTRESGGQQLRAEVEYPLGEPVFANEHVVLPGASAPAIFAAKKTCQGGTLTDGAFEFEVIDGSGKQIAAAKNDAEGFVLFPVTLFDKPGVYNCAMRETTQSDAEWNCDTREYPVTVTVQDYGGGKLAASVEYPSGSPSFINRHVSFGANSPASVALTARKEMRGRALQAGQYTFCVEDPYHKRVITATNDADGNINFPAMDIATPGTYHFTMYEKTPSANGVICDSTRHNVDVTVTESGNGPMTATVRHADGGDGPVFVNTYDLGDPPPVQVSLEGAKYLLGETLKAGQFSFAAYDSNGKEVATAANAANGSIAFSSFPISQTGTFDYTIRETSVSGKGYICDDKTFPATVTVTDNGAGALSASIAYPIGKPLFVNRYLPTDPPRPSAPYAPPCRPYPCQSCRYNQCNQCNQCNRRQNQYCGGPNYLSALCRLFGL